MMGGASERGTVPIVAKTARYVVVDKPPGLLSVPGRGPEKADCVSSRVAGMFSDASGPLVVHRLDMDTSGLMVLGLDAAAQRELSMQFESRVVEKRYVALIEGVFGAVGDEGVIDLPMRLDVENRPRQIVDHELGKAAQTGWRLVSHEECGGVAPPTCPCCTRVEFVARTGRSHQLRVHAAEGLGAAILGDDLYGDGGSAGRLMLHAAVLGFDEPGGGGRVVFESDAPF